MPTSPKPGKGDIEQHSTWLTQGHRGALIVKPRTPHIHSTLSPQDSPARDIQSNSMCTSLRATAEHGLSDPGQPAPVSH